jgi:hypothetical protein
MAKFSIHSKHRYPAPTLDWQQYTLRCNGGQLVPEQQAFFHNRVQDLRQGDCRVLYRGDRKTALARRYGLPDASDITEFNNRLYLFGQKGQHFYEETAALEARRGHDYTVDDHSDTFLGEIFDMLHGLLTLGTFPDNVQKRIDQFVRRETVAAGFFLDATNRHRFLQAFARRNDRERLQLRDYYLTLLHHLDKSEYYPISFLLSTTTSWQVAQQFSEKARQTGDDILLMGWVPYRSGKTLATGRFRTRSRQPDLLERTGLPRYKDTFFIWQREVTLKGGWFPHYLLVYFHSDKGQMVGEVNPFLFEPLADDWIRVGLPVNQQGFRTGLRQTGYRRGFLLRDSYDDMQELY